MSSRVRSTTCRRATGEDLLGKQEAAPVGASSEDEPISALKAKGQRSYRHELPRRPEELPPRLVKKARIRFARGERILGQELSESGG